MRSESGSMLPLVAALVFVAFVVVGLCVDVAVLHMGYRGVAIVADTAAEAGASMIDPDMLHGGQTALDQASARARALEVAMSLAPEGAEFVVQATDIEVCVQIRQQHDTVALAAVGARSVTIDVRSCATPRIG